jgi:hypothetical protein
MTVVGSPAASDPEGPMTMLKDRVANGKPEAEAAQSIVEEALIEAGSPKDQAKAFAELVAQAFTAKAVTGVAGKACEPYYRVQAVTPHGVFHCAGRKFTNDPKNPINKVYKKDLNEAQLKELLAANPKFLAVLPVSIE